MEIKYYKSYSKEEIIDLLSFWFSHYNDEPYSLKEFDTFRSMLERNPKGMMDIAILLYHYGFGPSALLKGIRGNLDIIENAINAKSGENPQAIDKTGESFIEEIVTSYNTTENSFSIENTLESLIKLNQNTSENSLSIEKLRTLLEELLIKDDELIDGNPNNNYVKVIESDKAFILSAKRLDKHKNEIKEMLDMLPLTKEPCELHYLALTNDGNIWAIDPNQIQLLMLLGISCGLVESCEPIEGIPTYRRKRKNPLKVVGATPDKFPSLKNIFESKKNTALSSTELAMEALNYSSKQAKSLMKILGVEIILEDGTIYLKNLASGAKEKADVSIKTNTITIDGPYNHDHLCYTFDYYGQTKDNELLIKDTITQCSKIDNVVIDKLSAEFTNDIENPEESFSAEIAYVNTSLNSEVYILKIGKDQIVLRVDDSLIGGDSTFVFFDDPSNTNAKIPLVIREEKSGNLLDIKIENYGNIYKCREEILSEENPDLNYIAIKEIKGTEKSIEVCHDILKTTKIKNLYSQIIESLEDFLPGIKRRILSSYEFLNNVENIMDGNVNQQVDDLVSRLQAPKKLTQMKRRI